MDRETLRQVHKLILDRASTLHLKRLDSPPSPDQTVKEMTDSVKESGRVLGLLDACDMVMGELTKAIYGRIGTMIISWDGHKRNCGIHPGKLHYMAFNAAYGWICAASKKDKLLLSAEALKESMKDFSALVERLNYKRP